MLKFNLFATLMLAFTLVFTGCGEQGTSETETADTTAVSEEVVAPETGTEMEEAPVEEAPKPLTEMFDGTLKTVFESTTLAETLASGEYTVFMPSEEVLMALKDKLADTAEAEKLMKNHIVAGKIGFADMATDQETDQELETLGGAKLKLSLKGGYIYVNDVEILENSDIEASNGYIHRVGQILVK